MEGWQNGIAPVSKTGGRKPLGVRILYPPQKMKTKKIFIINKQGYKIYGILHLAKNKNLIIICNGYDSTKDFLSIRLLAEGLNKKGFNVFRFDFTGTGESEGPKNVFLKQQVDDLDSVINYFKTSKKIILLGGSLGALSASIVSIMNSNISGLVTVNGFFGTSKLGKQVRKTYFLYRFFTFIKRDHRLDYRFFKNNFLPEKIKIPVLVIYTKNDNIVAPEQSIEFFSKLKTQNKKLHDLFLIKHDLIGKGDVNKVVESVFNWYKD